MQVLDLQYQFCVGRNKPRKASADEVEVSLWKLSGLSVMHHVGGRVSMAFHFFQALRHLVERDVGVTRRMQLSKASYRAWGP